MSAAKGSKMSNGAHRDFHVSGELTGFSGARLEIWRGQDQSWVRKTAQAAGKNSDLLAERTKLQWLSQLAKETSLFGVPELGEIGLGTGGELAYYDTEFIPGRDLAEILTDLRPSQSAGLATHCNHMIELFSQTWSMPQDQTNGQEGGLQSESEFLRGKLGETMLYLRDASQLHSELIDRVHEFNDQVLNLAIPTESNLGLASSCHGDLALDNVLMGREGQLFLIDPLPNLHESFMWDISKVLQSSMTNWESIKAGDIEVDLARGKVRAQSSVPVARFNAEFCDLVTQKHDPGAITLYVAVTLARIVKHAVTHEQQVALLLLTNEMLRRFNEGRHNLHEPLDTLCW